MNPCTALEKISRLPVLAVLIVLYLVFILYIFPNSSFDMDTGPLDLKFSYSPETAYEMIEAYGEEGRVNYARGAMTVDVAYPIVYTLMYMVWLTLVLKSINVSSPRRCFVSMLPLLVFILDMIENIGIITMLKLYPEQHKTLAMCTSFTTSAKWSVAGVVILITLGATLHLAWRRVVSR